MTRKGKKKAQPAQTESTSSPEHSGEQSHGSQQQQLPVQRQQQPVQPSQPPQTASGHAQRQRQQPVQASQQPQGPSQQQQPPLHPSQPRGPTQQTQRPWRPMQEGQRPQGPRHPSQQPRFPMQQSQRPQGPMQSSQRPPGPAPPSQRPQAVPWSAPQQQQQQQRPTQAGQWPQKAPQQQQQQQQPTQAGQQPQKAPWVAPQQQQQQQQPMQAGQQPQKAPWVTPQQQQQKQQPVQAGQPQQAMQSIQQQPQQPSTAAGSQAQHQQLPVRTSPAKTSIPSSLSTQLTLDIPKRKNPMQAGTTGRRIIVETNMLSLKFGGNFETHAVHYDVAIDPDKPKYLMRPVFEELRKSYFPQRYPAYDGKKNAYSGQNLPFGDYISKEVTVFNAERQREVKFKITLKKVADIDLSWLKTVQPGFNETEKDQTSMQVLDIILRHGPACRYVNVGRSLFVPPTRKISLTGGLDLWFGMFQSAVLGWKPLLNIDVAHKGFPTSQSVIDLMREICVPERENRDIEPRDVSYNSETLRKYLRGLKVQYEIPGQPTSKRTYKVNGLQKCPRHQTFKLEDGSVSNVEKYYKEKKEYTIRYPLIDCLWVGSMARDSPICLPPELCTIVPGQVTQKKMDEKQTSKMIREAATSTIVRKEKILDAFSKMKLNEAPTVKNEFRLAISEQFEKVPARVLDAPTLKYNNPKPVLVTKGTWNPVQFLSAEVLQDKSWTILNVSGRPLDRELYNFQRMLQEQGQELGMRIGIADVPFKSMRPPQRDIREILNYFNEKKQQNFQLIIVVIPDRTEIYSVVKQITELKIGLLTQCVKNRTIERLDPSKIRNILLKINSKLNGINHTFVQRPRCLSEPVIIVGADVTHPSPDATDIPSIAAVVASHDSCAFKYNIEIRLQPPRTEIIQDLKEIMYLQFIYFRKAVGHVPRRIIFYRDGVSESQLTQVMHFEIQAIRDAMRKLDPSGNYMPKITFLVVQKRHHIRLFPTDKRNSDDAHKNFNVQAGTIVDTHITHPSHIDFYLVSHASIQGTARPTKYKCICNENDMSEDEIEQLTYYLCHIFARCTRSVSYPAPTYYAHLAAFRARALIFNEKVRLDELPTEQDRLMALKKEIRSERPMFFV